MRPGASKDTIIDIGSKTTSVLELRSNEASQIDVISIVRTMVETLETSDTPEDQSVAFELAILNPVCKNLGNNKYIKRSLVGHSSIMSDPTPSAKRKQKSRKKKAVVQSILSEFSDSTQEEQNLIMREVLEDEGARNAMLALGYIKVDNKVNAALRGMEQQNKLL